MVVENRGGAGGVIAVEQVARSAPDGRTILFASVGAFVITNALKPQAGYDQLKTFAPVARIGAAPTLLIVKADAPFKTMGELIAKAKTDSKMSYGWPAPAPRCTSRPSSSTPSAGTQVHARAVSRHRARAQRQLGGHINFLNGDITVLYPLVKQGTSARSRVAGTQRSALLPDVPTARSSATRTSTWRTGTARWCRPRRRPTWWRSSSRGHGRHEEPGGLGEDLGQRRFTRRRTRKRFRAQIEKDVAYWGAADQEARHHGE